MIEATQPAFLVAPIDKRGLPVRAQLIKHAQPAFGISKRDIGFAQNFDAQWFAVRFGHFIHQADRRPVLTHQFRHRSITRHTGQNFVFFGGQHFITSPASRTVVVNLLHLTVYT